MGPPPPATLQQAATQIFGAATALLAGYLFVRFSLYRRFAAEHLRSDRFGLLVVAYAIIFFPCGAIADHYITKWWGEFESLAAFRSAGLSPIVFYSCFVALIAAAIANVGTLMIMRNDSALRLTDEPRLIPRIRLAAVALFVRNSNDPALRLLFRASFMRKLIIVTLKSGKVYIGETTRLVDPTDAARSLRLIPFKSGYRDPNTKKAVLNTNYDDLVSRLSAIDPDEEPPNSHGTHKDDPLRQDLSVLQVAEGVDATIDVEDLGVVILWNEIESLSIYNQNVHEAFKTRELDT